jgi:hypothetical protein
MDVLLFAALSTLALVGVLALLAGAESRDGFDTTDARPWARH